MRLSWTTLEIKRDRGGRHIHLAMWYTVEISASPGRVGHHRDNSLRDGWDRMRWYLEYVHDGVER